MYKSFYGLKENPFNVNPDPRFLYLTKQIEEALTGLMYGIQTRKGLHHPDRGSGHWQNHPGQPPFGLAAPP